MRTQRLPGNPIIKPHMDARMGDNINGPSLIKAPDWVEEPLGRYYLYFAHHQGDYIRLAYADQLEGPWRIHSPGALAKEDAGFLGHVASPDLHVRADKGEVWMYFHGARLPDRQGQFERLAISTNGLDFTVQEEILGKAYWRVFEWGGYHYALTMPGRFVRSKDGRRDFEEGPQFYTKDLRHPAVQVVGSTLRVFYSNAFDCPEHILLSTIDLTPDWMQWQPSEPESFLKPETECEGGDLPLEASRRGSVHEPVRQLRDPCIYEEDGKTYLVYSVAGEYGLGIAEIVEDQ